MKISDLNKIDIKDLKNLNYQKILHDLKSRPDIILSIVCIILAIIISVNNFKSRKTEISSLLQDITALENKVAAIDEYNSVKNELNQFIENIPPKIYEADVINLITDLAQKWKIQIESFTPSQTQREDLFSSTSFRLNVTANEYTDLWLFIHEIEKLPYALRVDSWHGNLSSQPRSLRQRSRKEWDLKTNIYIRLEISAINFKDT